MKSTFETYYVHEFKMRPVNVVVFFSLVTFCCSVEVRMRQTVEFNQVGV